MPPIDIACIDGLIEPGWRVLDVGCGEYPYRKATVCCDKHSEDGPSLAEGVRAWRDFGLRQKFVVGDVCRGLPFRRKAFDFVVCRNCLEHVEDPEAACRELSRVGRRGYIETPSVVIEIVFNASFHRWLVAERGGVLLFRRKEKMPFWTGYEEFCGRRIHGYDVRWAEAARALRDDLERYGACRVALVWRNRIEARVEGWNDG